ncbi:hypothetical protein BGZ50_009633 [Haplosporangium sp. Z 11]|nr:hypothetical protein BGZ50_009633 [Haplosporangium sp. Z 11]
MGVFGEKHTSLTREQKRQLIHQADTHKLRPTEVCDWVLATWGLRIARVTVYSILHKQRASLMAGHRDLYQSMRSNLNGSSSSSDTQSLGEDACLERNKDTGRVTKYRATSSSSKPARSTSSSAAGDRSASYTPSGLGEGARWEGQLKRVREPASVELDRAMVQFLKSSAAVDAHGRRLNDAELQSHALRLARGIPSASRMRCSFGWLRHFKRRLGVQWAADRLGRYRWIVEMDPFGPSNPTDETSPPSSPASSPAITPSPSPIAAGELSSTLSASSFSSSPSPAVAADAAPFSDDASPTATLANIAHNYSRRRLSHTQHQLQLHQQQLFQLQGNIKEELDDNRSSQSRSNSQPFHDALAEQEDEDEEYHSSQDLLGRDYSLTPTTGTSDLASAPTARYARSTSASTSISTSTSGTPIGSPITQRQYQHQHQQYQTRRNPLNPQQQQHKLYSFSESSPLSSFSQFPSSLNSQPLHTPTTPLVHPSQNTFLNFHPSSVPSIPQASSSQPSILDSFPSLFDSLPNLNNSTPTTASSAQQLWFSNPSTPLTNLHSSPTTPTATSVPIVGSNSSRLNSSQFGMSVDGGMRKVPSKDEAYDMLQSLLLYYEQDHHSFGEQQTLLLPRWIHQQRQVMQHPDESDTRMMWMRQPPPTPASVPAASSSSFLQQYAQVQAQTTFLSSSAPAVSSPFSQQLNAHPHQLSNQTLSYPHSNFPQAQTQTRVEAQTQTRAEAQTQTQTTLSQHERASSQSSSPPLSPLSVTSSTTNLSTMTSSSFNGYGHGHSYGHGHGNSPATGLDRFSAGISMPSSSSSASTLGSASATMSSAAFPPLSLTSSIEQQMFFAHHRALQQQYALHQQHQQQQALVLQQQQQQEQEQEHDQNEQRD